MHRLWRQKAGQVERVPRKSELERASLCLQDNQQPDTFASGQRNMLGAIALPTLAGLMRCLDLMNSSTQEGVTLEGGRSCNAGKVTSVCSKALLVHGRSRRGKSLHGAAPLQLWRFATACKTSTMEVFQVHPCLGSNSGFSSWPAVITTEYHEILTCMQSQNTSSTGHSVKVIK